MDGQETQEKRSALRVTVLMGGPSPERQVSIWSGQAVADALESAGHVVTRGEILPGKTEILDRGEIDVVFIAMHGNFGESGEVQQLCEERDLAYVGSGPTASRLAMDKAAAKQRFGRAGLETPDWIVIERFHSPEKTAAWLEELSLPAVVKPVDAGSSVDVYICRDPAQRSQALEEVIDSYGRALIERFVPGREVTVGILDRTPLPVIEIRPPGGFYDYRAKYSDEAGTRYVFDHGLDPDVIHALQRDAQAAHDALDCRDLSRVDFILDDDRVGHVLEINTIPGFTSHSLLPKAAAKVGIDLPQLCDRLIRMARRRHRARKDMP
jgi:D-alanine-D-alanine ligase